MSDPGEELVDVVDEDDRIIGTCTRREVRRRGLRHRSVYVLVFNARGELFVHTRTATKDVYPGHQDVAVGGICGAGESYETAAVREVAEELGVADVVVERLFAMRYQDGTNQVNGVVFRCIHEGPFRLQEAEIVSGEFVAHGALETRLREAPTCPDGLAALERFRAWQATRR
jgi:isopentenyldiphosphate isomerase